MKFPKDKDKPKKERKKTVSQLKKELDKIFSLYVRQKYANSKGRVKCFTCGVDRDVREIQNGHFISRSVLSLRFDERNCRPQCVGCNVFGSGKIATFGHKLEQENPGIVVELYKDARQIIKNYPYQAKIEEYKEKLKNL